MTASQNGWRVLTRDQCTDVELPGGEVPLHPEFAWLFQDLAIHWHDTVEHLLWPGCWGWAARNIRGSTTVISNHASGTALDLSAPLHPQGVPVTKTFTPAQLDAIAHLERRYFGVLRWGGRWTGKSVDGMHWEGQPGVTVEAVRGLTAMLRDGTPAPTPAPQAPPAPTGWSGPDAHGNGLGFRASVGNNGPRVQALQNFLRTRYPLYAKLLVCDGWYGNETARILAEYCRRSAIRSDGRDVGPQTARALYVAGFRA